MAIPFTVTNALNMCWGLTLKFSHESQQQEMGKEYFTKIMEKLNLTPIEKTFLAELEMILAKTTRNMGLIRVASIRHLERQAREYNDLKELLTAIGELSFSKESIPLKILSFLSFGSTIPTLLNLNPFKETLEGLKTAGDILKNTKGTIDVGQINELVRRIFEFGQFTTSVEQIILFILFGSIGIFVGSVMFKVFTHFYLNRKEENLKVSQTTYWEDHYIHKMETTLHYFYLDILDLWKRHYKYERSNPSADDPVMIVGDVRKYIHDKILPNVGIEWDIWLPSQEKSPSE
jgi:hypothetical protein